jgi:hypothetical protein
MTYRQSYLTDKSSHIPQKTSWSRLKLSYPMFCRLVLALNIAPTFFELVSTFGYKNTDTDGVFAACHSCFQQKTQVSSLSQHGRYQPYTRILLLRCSDSDRTRYMLQYPICGTTREEPKRPVVFSQPSGISSLFPCTKFYLDLY